MTYTTEAAKVTPSASGSFWFQGGSLDDGASFFRGFGWAADMSVEHASKIAPGFNLTETDILTGPRYTFHRGDKRETRLFIEALAGVARGSDDLFPTSRGYTNRANAFAWQAGGGLDIGITKHIAVRAIEADYVRTYLPNNGTNTQGHLRLAFGVAYHFQNH
jgi:peptidoglycan-associated lipoprotein